jgi:hypothetical protein
MTFRRKGNSIKYGLLLQLPWVFVVCTEARAQASPSLSEIPIERCDLLPVVKVRIDGTDMRFLLDTAASTMLNRFASRGLRFDPGHVHPILFGLLS